MIVKYRCRHFQLHELLPPFVYKDEEVGWSYFDENLLKTIDIVRDIVGKPLICNNWMWNGVRKNCGYREPECSVGVPNSQHKLGKAVDLICKDIPAEQIRKLIKKNADKLPCNIRLEKGVSWVHIDTKDMGVKIYEFKG